MPLFITSHKTPIGTLNLIAREEVLLAANLSTISAAKASLDEDDCTNGFKEVQFVKLEKSRLKQFFDVIVCSEEVDGLIVLEVIDEDLSDLLLPDFEEDNDLPILPDFALELSRFLDCRMAPLLLFLCCLSCGCCFRSFIVLESSMYC